MTTTTKPTMPRYTAEDLKAHELYRRVAALSFEFPLTAILAECVQQMRAMGVTESAIREMLRDMAREEE